MADTLYLTNFPEPNIVERTQIAADVAAAATTVTVKNVDNFANNDIIVLGELGSEQAEKKQITSLDSSTQIITIPALTFKHYNLEPLTKIRGDKIRLYRAANVDGTQPDDGDFSLITTVTIQVSKTYTEYVDEDGGDGYWYKMTYYNSVDSSETDIAESEAIRGGNYGHYATVEQVRRTAGFVDNSDITDDVIAEARDEAESVIKGYIVSSGYYLPLTTPYPPSLVRLVKQLAAAYLLQDEYGASTEGTDKDGYAKEEAVMKRLEKIQDGTITLIDVHKETNTSKKDDVSGWPDDTTEDTPSYQHGGKPKFTMSKNW